MYVCIIYLLLIKLKQISILTYLLIQFIINFYFILKIFINCFIQILQITLFMIQTAFLEIFFSHYSINNNNHHNYYLLLVNCIFNSIPALIIINFFSFLVLTNIFHYQSILQFCNIFYFLLPVIILTIFILILIKSAPLLKFFTIFN